MCSPLRWSLVAFFLGACPFIQAQTQPIQPVSSTAPAKDPNAVAATVNGQQIFEIAVDRALINVPADKRADARPDVLNLLIDNALVEQYLQQMQIPVDNAVIDKRLADMKAEAAKEKKDFAAELKKGQLTEDELKRFIAADLRWEAFITKQIDETKLKAFYEANTDMFDGSMVRARHILLTPPPGDVKAEAEATAKLQKIREKIEADVNAGMAKLPANADKLEQEKARTGLLDDTFAAQARAESVCPSKKQGGDIGWFARAGTVVEPFARAAFACKPHQMTEVVKTQFGCHLILVLERKPGREVKYADVKDMVREIYGDKLRESVVYMMRQRAKIAMK